MQASSYRHKVYNPLATKGKKRSAQTRDWRVTYGDDPQMRMVMRALWREQCIRIRSEDPKLRKANG
jgi:hypothetical protein